MTELGQSQSFEVVQMRTGTLPGASPDQLVAFMKQLAELQRDVNGARSAIDETTKRVEAIQQALMRSTVGDASLGQSALAIERQLADLRLQLVGSRQRRMMGDPGPVSISARVNVASMGGRLSTYGPTPMHSQSFEIAREEFAELRERLKRIIDVELPQLEKELDAAGVPWTPGRGVPAETR